MNRKFAVLTKNKIKKFERTIYVESDKSISHRTLLIASQCIGPSYLKNVLESEDVKNTINCLKKLGVKILKNKKKIYCFRKWTLLIQKTSEKFALYGQFRNSC